MKVVGLITEYNPFHKGHEYHIQKAKEMTGADYIITIMSGDYVQRGTPAIVEKHVRAHMALVCGVDLVLELPIIYATGSAEIFAEGAVRILDNLGVVDSICFGCECGSVSPLMEIARILNNEPKWYSEAFQKYLKEGYSYPAARAAALPEYTDILNSPNNILGIEYCKAILKTDASLEPIGIQRKGNEYHSDKLDQHLPSATAIRQTLIGTENNIFDIEDVQYLADHIPQTALDVFTDHILKNGIIYENDLSSMLLYRLLQAESYLDFLVYEDISKQLASRIFNLRNKFINFTQFADLIKTKDITRTHVNRALLHILLNIRASIPYASYARILGLRKDAKELLSFIKAKSKIPFFSKSADADQLLDEQQLELFEATTNASMIYEGLKAQNNRIELIHEHSKAIIIV